METRCRYCGPKQFSGATLDGSDDNYPYSTPYSKLRNSGCYPVRECETGGSAGKMEVEIVAVYFDVLTYKSCVDQLSLFRQDWLDIGIAFCCGVI